MPNYDMRCTKQGCGYTGEYRFPMNTPQKDFPHCPECSATLEKAVQSPNISTHKEAEKTVCTAVNAMTGEVVPLNELSVKGLTMASCPDCGGLTPALVADKKSNIKKRNRRISFPSEN